MIYVDQKELGSVKELARICSVLKEDLEVTYRLIKAECPEAVYLISVSGKEERGYIFAGTSESEARMLFVTLVSGEVTPCSAQEVASDILRILYMEK